MARLPKSATKNDMSALENCIVFSKYSMKHWDCPACDEVAVTGSGKSA